MASVTKVCNFFCNRNKGRGRYLVLGHFSFPNFLNYLSQKLKKIKITVLKSDNLTMYGNCCSELY